jgi:uncharacterized protein with HEPN domain
MERDAASLVDIVLACREINQFVGGLTQKQFVANSLVRSAVIYQMQIVGEAAKRVSAEFRASHPSVPWRQMAGMRDRLIHGYDDINLGIVWHVATVEVPLALSRLEPLVPRTAIP